MSSTQTLSANPVRLKSVAIPNEHGGWGFLLEPLILGLLLAPTTAGLSIALGTVGAFLARHPLKLTATDWRRGRRFARTRLAEQVAAAYILIALLGLALAIAQTGPGILAPLLIAAPLGLLQLGFDFRGQSRHLLPELAGPVALATSAAMITLAGGWQLQPALMLTVLLTARAIPSIQYVRARLRLSKGLPASPAAAIAWHLASVALAAALATASLTPWLAIVALGILTLRAAWILQKRYQDVPARVIGFLEIGFGLLTVLLTAAGYTFHL